MPFRVKERSSRPHMLTIVTYLLLIAAGAPASEKLPRIDLHVHLDDNGNPPRNMTPADAAELSARMGVRFGVLGEGGCIGDIHDDQTLSAFLRPFDGLPLYRGLQVYGFDWPRCFSKEKLGRLDYIAADALIF